MLIWCSLRTSVNPSPPHVTVRPSEITLWSAFIFSNSSTPKPMSTPSPVKMSEATKPYLSRVGGFRPISPAHAVAGSSCWRKYKQRSHKLNILFHLLSHHTLRALFFSSSIICPIMSPKVVLSHSLHSSNIPYTSPAKSHIAAQLTLLVMRTI